MRNLITSQDTLTERGVFTLVSMIVNTCLSKFNLLVRTLWSAVLCAKLLVERLLAVVTETVRHDINLRIVGGSLGGGFLGKKVSQFSKDYSHFCVRKRSKQDLGFVFTKKKTELESPKLLPKLLLLRGCNIKKGVKK